MRSIWLETGDWRRHKRDDSEAASVTVVALAGLAQLVEHRSCKAVVAGSIPAPGSKKSPVSSQTADYVLVSEPDRTVMEGPR